jgi:hypothetical protein
MDRSCEQFSADLSRLPLYLRTDLSFGVRAGDRLVTLPAS